MQELSIRNRWIARAEVAIGMQNSSNSEDKILFAYKLLNSLNNTEIKNYYIEALLDYLSEYEFAVVISEMNYDKFDNISFWVNKTVQDIIYYYDRNIEVYPEKLVTDKMKGTFSIFICDFVSPLSIKAAHELCDAIINTPELSFLHEAAFFERTNLDNWLENPDKSEDEYYLDLLDLEFAPFDILDAYVDREARRNLALKQRENKKQNKENACQLSFKHLCRSIHNIELTVDKENACQLSFKHLLETGN